jgi:hypothetical protein
LARHAEPKKAFVTVIVPGKGAGPISLRFKDQKKRGPSHDFLVLRTNPKSKKVQELK